jgi:sugar/nucleoside kinase (ribokinase family)
VGSAVFLGLSTIDVIFSVESLPQENSKSVALQQEVLCGGPAANAAITCAFLGANTKLVSSVGDHPLSSLIRKELSNFKVSLHDLDPTSLEIPAISSIFVTRKTGARTIISGHATRRPPPNAKLPSSILGDAALLLVDGHGLPHAIDASAEANVLGIPVVLDGGTWTDSIEQLLPNIRIAICSEAFGPPGTSSLRDVLDYVLARGPEAAAITRGLKPIIWATRHDRGELVPPAIDAIDTLGAGDIFHGAFCFQLLQGSPLLDALAFAADVAAYSCQSFGTRSWMNTYPHR